MGRPWALRPLCGPLWALRPCRHGGRWCLPCHVLRIGRRWPLPPLVCGGGACVPCKRRQRCAVAVSLASKAAAVWRWCAGVIAPCRGPYAVPLAVLAALPPCGGGVLVSVSLRRPWAVPCPLVCWCPCWCGRVRPSVLAGVLVSVSVLVGRPWRGACACGVLNLSKIGGRGWLAVSAACGAYGVRLPCGVGGWCRASGGRGGRPSVTPTSASGGRGGRLAGWCAILVRWWCPRRRCHLAMPCGNRPTCQISGGRPCRWLACRPYRTR